MSPAWSLTSRPNLNNVVKVCACTVIAVIAHSTKTACALFPQLSLRQCVSDPFHRHAPPLTGVSFLGAYQRSIQYSQRFHYASDNVLLSEVRLLCIFRTCA